MKHYLLLLIIPFAFFSCCFGLCEPSIHPKPFNFCEYNPEKARAEILQIHNFQSLFDTSLQFIYICEHAEKFYFASNINDKEITICIVDKATMTLENKVKITLEDIENEVKTYTPASLLDFEVFYNKAYFQIEWSYRHYNENSYTYTTEYIYKLLTFDFSDNTLAKLDTFKTFGIDIDDIDNFTIDQVTNRFCLQDYNKLNFFTYDKSNNTYIKDEIIEIEEYKNIEIHEFDDFAFFDTNVLNIYGNTICRSGSIDNNYNKGDTTYILLSDIADVTKDKFIILNYLEYTYFNDVLYDGEFVWVITGNKNENNQLLKLKLL